MNNVTTYRDCIQLASEAYRQGYADAMKLYQEEILKASQSRPIQFVLPENYAQQRSSAEDKSSTLPDGNVR